MKGPKKIYDAIVLGIGGMGSAACLSLARRGVSVLGLEQFDLAHDRGSSHGNTRMIRKAYFESESYIPLLHRSYALWDGLEKDTQVSLFHRVGLLILGKAGGGIAIDRMQVAAKNHGIRLEVHEAQSLRARFPWFSPPADYMGLFEPDAGYLLVEKCVEAQAKFAEQLGAELHFNETVESWDIVSSGIVVNTTNRKYTCRKLIVAGGPWSGKLLASIGLPLIIRRAPQFWFEASMDFSKAPCFAFDLPGQFIYGFPSTKDRGVKIAEYEPKEVVTDPATVNRNILTGDASNIQKCISEYLPSISPVPVASSTCMYTLTPDENFIIDVHPNCSDIVIAAGFSGHGFKFAPLIGECLADLALDGGTKLPIDFLRRRW